MDYDKIKAGVKLVDIETSIPLGVRRLKDLLNNNEASERYSLDNETLILN